MTAGREERLVVALESIAKSLATRLEKEFPTRVPKVGSINRASDEKREQYSDTPDEKWTEETEAALPPSRFETRFREETQPAGKTGGRSPKKDRH